MCGIAGIWQHGDHDDAAALAAMLHAMRHRGPDGLGSHEFAGGALGMVRLALVDLSERGQQPMWSADRQVALLFNGEMYNFREERAALERAGYPFRSNTDTEVVLALFLRDGLDFVKRLRGMFALAIFDWRGRSANALPQLVLARDPLGIKPLYVWQGQGVCGSLVFASEIRALLASGLVPRQIAAPGLVDYLHHGYILQPHTILAGVRMVEAGHLEYFTPGEPPRQTRFWSFPAYAPRAESLDEAAGRLRGLLEESIRLHALADAPVGAFLSGGVDSTAIVALMKQHVPSLATFTLRYPGAAALDESHEATQFARSVGCRNVVVDVTGREVANQVERFAGDLDQPSWDGLNTWLVARAASTEVKGVLSGLGGDELFAGYPVVRRMARYQQTRTGRLQRLAGGIAHRLDSLLPAGRIRERLRNLASRRHALATWEQAHLVFRRDEAYRLTGVRTPPEADGCPLAQLVQRHSTGTESVLGQGFLLDTIAYMGSQLLRDSDATSMAHSLELRVPFVDPELIVFTRTCNDQYKLPLNEPQGSPGAGIKRVLLHALRDVLPADMMTRPKRGFAMPFRQWLQAELAPLLAETCSPAVVRQRGLLDAGQVSRLYARRDAYDGQALYPQLWSVMVLELWCRAVLDRRPSVRPGALPLPAAS